MILREAILYVKDSQHEGFLTFHEALYPYLPRQEPRITNEKAPQSDLKSDKEQIHYRA